MARYFFDVDDGTMQRDEEGTGCASSEEARAQTMKFLPDLARQHAFDGGDRHTYTVLVSDEHHHPVYSATLSLVGLWLRR